MFYFLRQKIKCQIFVEYAYAASLSEKKEVKGNLIIFRDQHALITFVNVVKKYDFSVFIKLMVSAKNQKLKAILKLDTIR